MTTFSSAALFDMARKNIIKPNPVVPCKRDTDPLRQLPGYIKTITTTTTMTPSRLNTMSMSLQPLPNKCTCCNTQSVVVISPTTNATARGPWRCASNLRPASLKWTLAGSSFHRRAGERRPAFCKRLFCQFRSHLYHVREI